VRPLRIGIDIGKALGVSDGLATSSRLLVHSLLEVDREDEYHLFDLHHPELDEARLAEVFPTLPGNARVHRERPAAVELDLFHGPAHRLAAVPGLRTVFTLHDLTFLSHHRLHTLRNRLETLLACSQAIRAGARFIAVSAHTREQAMRLLRLRPERLAVVHWAADPAFRPLTEPGQIAAVGVRLGIDRPYLLSVGSLEPRKNLDTLVDAFTQLPAALRDRHALVIVGGPGWRNRAIVERIERAAAECTVIRVGAVPLSDLVALYNGAVALAYPSLAEGFGLPVLEAMACGTPVVTSSTSSLPEVAGDAALLVDPHDPAGLSAALERLLSDPGLRADLRHRGLARAATFSWRHTALETLEVYRRTCAAESAISCQRSAISSPNPPSVPGREGG
jgi:glycosyltransferase involved in cell wall biosynthesis